MRLQKTEASEEHGADITDITDDEADKMEDEETLGRIYEEEEKEDRGEEFFWIPGLRRRRRDGGDR